MENKQNNRPNFYHSYEDDVELELQRMIDEGGAMFEGFTPYYRNVDGGRPPLEESTGQ